MSLQYCTLACLWLKNIHLSEKYHVQVFSDGHKFKITKLVFAADKSTVVLFKGSSKIALAENVVKHNQYIEIKHYPDSEPPNLCSFSLILGASRRRNQYKSYNLVFNPTTARNPRSTALDASTLTITPQMRM